MWVSTHPCGIGSKPDTPFNIQEFRKSSAGLLTHDVEEGMTDEEILERKAIRPFSQWLPCR